MTAPNGLPSLMAARRRHTGIQRRQPGTPGSKWVGAVFAAVVVNLSTGCGDGPMQASTQGTSYSNGGSMPVSYPAGGQSTYSSPSGSATYGMGFPTPDGVGNGGASAIYGSPPPCPESTNKFGFTATASAAPNCRGSATSEPPAGSGLTPGHTRLEAVITDRQEAGIFRKLLKAVTIAVVNNDRVEQNRFLLVVFVRNGIEVDVQYKSLRMKPGMRESFTFSASKDADDAKVELRDTLL